MRRHRLPLTLSDSASPALRFLTAAFSAMPATLGDRERSAAMNDVMHIALRCRMAFSPDDAIHLQQLSLRSCVGVFDALDPMFYAVACKAGGTYPRMWEKAKAIRPWIAARAAIDQFDIRLDHRVAPGVAVLIRADESEQGLPRIGPHQVWWCTSMDGDQTLRFGRYRLPEARSNPFLREGRPAHLRSFTREQWEAAQAAERAAEQTEAA